jgi:fluoroquinolone transport system permease protein
MSARLTTLLALDLRLQRRYGIYYAYAFVILFYAGTLYFAGDYLPAWVVGLVVYTDPAVVGFFFIGALMMLEKAEGARSALAMTPISAGEYLLSKTMTLSGVSLVSVIVIGSLAHSDTSWPVLLPATLLTSITFIGIGAPIALRFKTVTAYLIGSTGYLVPAILPAGFALFDPMPVWAIIIPTASQLELIQIGLGKTPQGGWEMAAMFAVAGVMAVAAQWFGMRSLAGELGRK